MWYARQCASLTAWLAQWDDPPGPAGLVSLLERLVVEQPFLLGLGVLGLAAGWRRADAAPGRRRAMLATGGLALAMAWAERATATGRVPLTLLLAVAAALAVGSVPPGATLPTAWRGRLVLAGATLGIAALALVTLRGATHPPSRGEGSQAGVRLLAADVASLCAWQVGDPRECSVQVVGDPRDDALLAWYLRDQERLRFSASPPSRILDPASPPLIVTPDAGAAWRVNALAARLPRGYTGSRYRIRVGAAGPVGVILWVPPERSGPGRATAPPAEPDGRP